MEESNQLVNEFNAWMEQFQQWEKDGKTLRFFNAVNRCYAALRSKQRQDGAAFRWDKQLTKATKMRKHLLEHRLKLNEFQPPENRSILTWVQVGDEQTLYLLDTGASLVTLSPELTTALGWDSRKGEAHDVTLAGGIRKQAHSITLTTVQVNEFVRDNIDGSVFPASAYGIDGLLGQSFLNHFNLVTSTDGIGTFVLIPKG